MKSILVTGGAGFIGSAVVRRLVCQRRPLTNLDKLTYSGNPAPLKLIENWLTHILVEGDIADCDLVLRLLREYAVEGGRSLRPQTLCAAIAAAGDSR